MLKDTLLSLNIFEDNEYLDAYIKLIEANKETKKEQFKTALHHIIPKAYFKKMNLPIDNSKNNLVNLLHKDHALAHYYIALATKDKYFLYSSMSALQHIMGFNKKMKQEDITTFISNLDKYQELVEQKNRYHSEHTKGLLAGDKNPAKRPEVREKIKKDWHKKHLNSCNTGRKHTEEWKQKQREKRKGLLSITDGINQKYISQDDLQLYLNKGWHKGSKIKGRKQSESHRKKNSEARSGMIRVTNGLINKCIWPEDFSYWEVKGYWRGLTKDSSIINHRKGKHLTEEQKKHLSDLNKGKKGAFTGKHHTAQTKRLISMKNKGIKRSDEFRNKLSKSLKGRVAIHKPDINKTKYIDREEIAKFIEEGYVLGGAKRNSEDR